MCELGRDRVMFLCANVYDVALYGNTARNVALGLCMVGYLWYIISVTFTFKNIIDVVTIVFNNAGFS